MYPSKQELEEIWNSGPIGWLKEHSKDIKNKRPYKVSYIPYVQTELTEHEVSMTVWAKSPSRAQEKASYNLREKLYKLHDSGIIPKIAFTTKVTQL